MKRQNSFSFVLWATAFLALMLPWNAEATTFFEESFVCPVGGEEFTGSVIGSNTTFGSRPDGRPYSPLPVYPITECPGNGFLIFKEEWAPEELAVLAEAIETPEFQRMRVEETSYYRLWWLSGRIDSDPSLLAEHLMVASWETDENGARKARYQNAFVDAVTHLERAADPENWFWLNLRAANALRELGRFDAAAVQFTTVEENLSIVSDENVREDVQQFIVKLQQLIVERNAASEPANLVPANAAAFRCVLASDRLTESELPTCQSDSVQDAIERIQIETENGTPLVGSDAIRYLAEEFGYIL